MAGRLVAVDASSLIGLSAIGAFDLLEGLFGTIVVTDAVRDEVLAGQGLPGASDLEAGVAAGWVTVMPVCQATAGAAFPKLGTGEATTLEFAGEHDGACLVVMDEQLGRAHARAHSVPVTGLVGVLLEAKREGLIETVAPYLQRLLESAFRISPTLVQDALTRAQE